MARLMAFIFFLFPLNGVAQDCVRGEPEAILDQDALIDYRFNRDEEGATEEGQLSEDVSLLLRHSGCAHFTLTWMYTIQRGAEFEITGQAVLLKAAELLSQTSANDIWTGVINEIEQKLNDRAKAGDYDLGYPIEIQAGYSFLYIDSRKDDEDRLIVEVSYDIVL